MNRISSRAGLHAAWLPIAMAAAVLVTACAPKPDDDAGAAPNASVQGNVVQFPANSPQLAVLESRAISANTDPVIEIVGRLAWDETRTTRLYPPMAGRITGLDATAGQTVKKGQVLARLSSPDMGEAQAAAAKAEADLTQARTSLERARQLDAAGVIARRDLESAQGDMARASAEQSRTKARLGSYGAGSSVDQMFVLRSPMAGVVVERNANPGQEFRPDGSSPALFTVSDPSHLWAQFDLPESAVGVARLGQKIDVKVDALPGVTFQAVIDQVADGLDSQTRTLRVRASVPNDERRLKSEMFVRGQLHLPADSRALLPATGIVLINGKQYLFIDEGGGKYERREVRAEDAGLERMRILDPLKPDEKVVVGGALFLQQMIAGQRQ